MSTTIIVGRESDAVGVMVGSVTSVEVGLEVSVTDGVGMTPGAKHVDKQQFWNNKPLRTSTDLEYYCYSFVMLATYSCLHGLLLNPDCNGQCDVHNSGVFVIKLFLLE